MKNFAVCAEFCRACRAKYVVVKCRTVWNGEHLCISVNMVLMMASLSHCSVVYGNVGVILLISAGVMLFRG